jgi:glycosyltransferase involved in cell wall biosynthesis
MTLHGSGTAQPSDAPLRVLILTDHVGGGTGRHILSLVGAFDPARAQVVVMSEGSVHSESPEALRVRRMPRLSHLHRFPFAQAHSLRLLMAELRRSPVDVLHTYGLWPILYGRLLKKLGRVQHLVENRECDGPTWGMHCDPVLRASGSAADRVICVSRSVAEDVAAREGLGDRAIEVIENGATKTEARYSREEARRLLGLPPEAFVIGCVASHIDRPVKGITHLAGAAPEILRRVPDAWFVIVGGRSPGSPVEGEMQRRQIMHRVVLPGYRDDVADLYPAMDVLAMPSLSEGLSIALLEAMRHSVPIVATRVGGNPEVLVEGETGFLVNVGDAVALADRIIALAEAPALREAMGRAGSDRFERVFNINQTARRYEQLYGTVCREHVVSG